MTDEREQKNLGFVGAALRELRNLDDTSKRNIGFQLYALQKGETPQDFKPMKTVGAGVYEIRVKDEENKNTGRCFYIAKFDHQIHVLHCFKKKSQKTPRENIEIGKKRYAELIQNLSLKEKKNANKNKSNNRK